MAIAAASDAAPDGRPALLGARAGARVDHQTSVASGSELSPVVLGLVALGPVPLEIICVAGPGIPGDAHVLQGRDDVVDVLPPVASSIGIIDACIGTNEACIGTNEGCIGTNEGCMCSPAYFGTNDEADIGTFNAYTRGYLGTSEAYIGAFNACTAAYIGTSEPYISACTAAYVATCEPFSGTGTGSEA